MSSFDMGVEASTALRLGALLLSAGAPGYRVTRAVKRCARAMHFDDADVVVGFDTTRALSTAVIISARSWLIFRCQG